MEAISLDLGELSIALKLENDAFRRQLADVKRELEGLPPAAQREVVKITRTFEQEGQKSGGALAKGINAGLIRNSPLIAAGVSAALAAGAPVATAAAVTLFAGIGAVAAAQSVEVQAAWTDLWAEIRDSTVEDAAVLVPTFVNMADKIGTAFQEMRPQLQDAFAASAPGIDAFTDGLIDAADNAMPALVRAVESSGPVMDGLASLMSDVGTGMGGFFDAISSHGPAAGDAFAAIGQIVAELLPTLGELMGSGAELASVVLPPLADALGAVADVAAGLGPLLPALVLGFAGFKTAQAAAGFMQTFALQAQFATTALTGNATAGTRAGTALSAFGKALPALGVVFAAATAAASDNQQQIDEWSQAILRGGDAAEEAAAKAQEASDGWFNAITDFGQFGGHEGADSVFEQMFGGDDDELWHAATKNARDLTAAMTPLERAQRDVANASDEVADAQDKYGVNSDEARAASERYQAAQAVLEGRQNALANATRSVTQAISEQAAQALAATSSELGYQMAVDGVQSSQEAYNAAIRDHGAASEEASDASLQLAQSVISAAQAAGQMAADALPATTSELERNTAAQQGTLRELYRMRDEMGANLPAAAGAAIARLEAAGVTLDATGATANATAREMSALGLSVQAIPNEKFVRVNAPTADQQQRLRDLGYQVINLPNGDVYVAANTADAESALNQVARTRTSVINAVANVGQAIASFGSIGNANGNILSTGHGFALGGFASGGWANARPFDPSVAQVFPPNQLRYAGDRIRDDEAYIPINDDPRSRAIFEQTAARMGYSLARGAAGPGYVGTAAPASAAPAASATTSPGYVDNSVTNINSYASEERVARLVENQRRDREFLAGVI